MKNGNPRLLLAILLLVVAVACNNKPKTTKATVADKIDTLHLWADTSLAVIVNEQKKAFQNIYTNPVLLITYVNEKQIINGLMENKINSAILHRSLLDNENAVLKGKEDFLPKQYVFAYDAYVCLTNEENARTSVSMSELKTYFINSKALDFRLTLENPQCQAVQFLKKEFSLSNEQLSSAFANKNLAELLAFLKTDAKAIGIIPYAYISDAAAPSTAAMMGGLKVLPVAYVDSMKNNRVAEPSQETITTREYPLISPLVFVNCNMEKKSGTNFVNYLFKPLAQRLILRCGLCPAIFPGREVIIKTN